MNKKSQSIIVILFTMICVFIMLFSNQISDETNLIRNKILVIGKNNSLHNKNNNLEKQNNIEKINSTEKNDSTSKEIKVKNDSEPKNNISNSSVMIEKCKKNKMDRINEQLEQDKQEFFSGDSLKENIDEQKKLTDDQKKSEEKSNKDVNNNSDSSKEDVSVFKVSRSQINDSLTLSDKAKLLSVASKLSAIDYEKVKKCIESGKDQDVKNAIKLLKERLSENDYDKVKEVAKKFINMEVVER